MTTFRWAILGTGMVSRNFLLGLRSSTFDTRITAVASRAKANAERFARDFRVPFFASDSFGAVCASPEVDAVYVATPPAVHEKHALLAIAAGKPVLVEKPFAMNAASARRIVTAARSAGVFCMEAMWTRFLPLVRHMKHLVDGGALGELRACSGSFSTALRRDVETGIVSAQAGGGALMYRGVYPLSLACLVMGPVTEAHAVATFSETKVDEDVIVACRHTRGLSTIQAGIRTDAPNDFRIMGAAGAIHVESPIYRPFRLRFRRLETGEASRLPASLREWLGKHRAAQGLARRARKAIDLARRGRVHTTTRRFAGNGYHYEADELMRSVRAGQTESDILPLADSLMVMEALDRIRTGRAWRLEA